MAIAISQTLEALCAVVQSLPIGTNLALLHFLWMQLSGTLLLSRGALFPALQASGLFPAAVRRAWAAFHSGAWELGELLSAWENYVRQQRQWQAHPYDGYYPKAVDLTAYWRPTLKGCPSKHYYPQPRKHFLPSCWASLPESEASMGNAWRSSPNLCALTQRLPPKQDCKLASCCGQQRH